MNKIKTNSYYKNKNNILLYNRKLKMKLTILKIKKKFYKI